jgi:hypothetical protein
VYAQDSLPIANTHIIQDRKTMREVDPQQKSPANEKKDMLIAGYAETNLLSKNLHQDHQQATILHTVQPTKKQTKTEEQEV